MTRDECRACGHDRSDHDLEFDGGPCSVALDGTGFPSICDCRGFEDAA